MTLEQLVQASAQRLAEAGVSFGHGTQNAHDEAAWLVLWRLGLPLDEAIDARPVTAEQQAQVQALVAQRIATRKPAAYLTREAWLQGVPFYVDERAIVPRSLIAEVLADGTIDAWLSDQTHDVLDLCTGNGSLAVLAALAVSGLPVDRFCFEGFAQKRSELARRLSVDGTTKPVAFADQFSAVG